MTTGMLSSALLEEPVELLETVIAKTIKAVAKLHTTQDNSNIAKHNKRCGKVNENSVL